MAQGVVAVCLRLELLFKRAEGFLFM
jgi:hypothetical protein